MLNCDGLRNNISARQNLTRHRRIRISELVVASQPLQEHKHQDVDRDEDVVNHRRDRASSVVITNWKKHLLERRHPACGSPASCRCSSLLFYSVAASANARLPSANSRFISAGVPNTRAFASSNSPSQRATTTVARQFPKTFTEVRPMSINSSTPKITATPIGPSPA